MEEKKEKKENADITATPNNDSGWLKIKLKKPAEYQGISVTELDLSGMNDMTGRDMNVIYDLYSNMGGTGFALQESTLLFAQIIASRSTGYPLELFQNMSAKDSVALKHRVYRFFYLEA